MNPAHCDHDPSGRHRPMYEDGAIVHIAGNRLLATCRCCGQRLERPHVRSSWWSAVGTTTQTIEATT